MVEKSFSTFILKKWLPLQRIKKRKRIKYKAIKHLSLVAIAEFCYLLLSNILIFAIKLARSSSQ